MCFFYASFPFHSSSLGLLSSHFSGKISMSPFLFLPRLPFLLQLLHMRKNCKFFHIDTVLNCITHLCSCSQELRGVLGQPRHHFSVILDVSALLTTPNPALFLLCSLDPALGSRIKAQSLVGLAFYKCTLIYNSGVMQSSSQACKHLSWITF